MESRKGEEKMNKKVVLLVMPVVTMAWVASSESGEAREGGPFPLYYDLTAIGATSLLEDTAYFYYKPLVWLNGGVGYPLGNWRLRNDTGAVVTAERQNNFDQIYSSTEVSYQFPDLRVVAGVNFDVYFGSMLKDDVSFCTGAQKHFSTGTDLLFFVKHARTVDDETIRNLCKFSASQKLTDMLNAGVDVFGISAPGDDNWFIVQPTLSVQLSERASFKVFVAGLRLGESDQEVKAGGVLSVNLFRSR
jgi:hypothetical protein